MPPSLKPRVTARQREFRRIRILGMVRAGFSYEAIARQESLSRERVRQIVVKSLDERESDTPLDRARVQAARLEPALRLAASGVADGDLRAIDRLLKVLARLDRYEAVVGAPKPYDENIRAKLLARLNRMSEAIIAERDGPPPPGAPAEEEQGWEDEAAAEGEADKDDGGDDRGSAILGS